MSPEWVSSSSPPFRSARSRLPSESWSRTCTEQHTALSSRISTKISSRFQQAERWLIDLLVTSSLRGRFTANDQKDFRVPLSKAVQQSPSEVAVKFHCYHQAESWWSLGQLPVKMAFTINYWPPMIPRSSGQCHKNRNTRLERSEAEETHTEQLVDIPDN